MKNARLAFAAICLSIAGSFPAHAVQPVYRLSSTCSMPTMPKQGSHKEDWDTYAALVRDYNECLGAKMATYGGKAKDALEGVGNTVTNLSESASAWFNR